MERKAVSTIILLTYLVIVIVSLLWAYYYLNLNAGDWIAVISLLVFGGLFVFEGLGYILKILGEPRLRIVNPKVEIDATSKFKDLIFDIENNGKIEAKGCKIEVRTQTWKKFGTLEGEKIIEEKTVDIIPDDKVSVRLCKVDEKSPKVAIFGTPEHEYVDYPALDKGKIYGIEIHLKGSNFVSKKIYNLKLDLSSWEEIGLELDC